MRTRTLFNPNNLQFDLTALKVRYACYILSISNLSGLFLLFTICSFGQLKQNQAIDSLFLDWNKPDVPGCAIGIIENGQLIYSKGYGIADLEHDVQITPTSVFYIGSVSKQFVTFSILLLEEQGKLNLDDKIQKYLPDFPEYDSTLTIRNFIHHTSGVRDYLTLMYLKGRNYLDNTDNRQSELENRSFSKTWISNGSIKKFI